MTPNEALIHQFYTAFQQKDVKTMQNSYDDQAIFNDAVFINLDAQEVRAMWQMLLSRSEDMKLSFGKVKEDGDKVTAYWEAHYTFTATGKKVVNKIDAEFEIKDGKIIRHTDTFNFYKWARQAFGSGGLLLGWTNVFKEKVRQTAKKKLDDYMQKLNQQ
ncbi:nuclear transport factor 2 family protein [Pedobacter chitinilyticus]|uniref:Nuclear transport factor 2 family protein n=1 Tax=Pedobacter chitinilyticus TaxID=2233776 RepID=A0A3S3PYS5_9SPHI|nr:nuclear transport factor 2 family protein [Pedobacter chitinilyticus]RWU07355.1 nuclear transport factor 2 family protein [Pedobacter chitinilyticus]